MSSPSMPAWTKANAVPIVLFAIAVLAVTMVPPLVLGEATATTYTITAAVLTIAIGASLPYALCIAIITLPLLYSGAASFGAPDPSSSTPHPFTPGAAVRHVGAGIAYVLVAAVVGGIGIGAQFGTPESASGVAGMLQPHLQVGGGLVVGTAFVGLQLWRYETPVTSLGFQRVFGTLILGMFLSITPPIMFWVFTTSI